jgi:hypothetical protein
MNIGIIHKVHQLVNIGLLFLPKLETWLEIIMKTMHMKQKKNQTSFFTWIGSPQLCICFTCNFIVAHIP